MEDSRRGGRRSIPDGPSIDHRVRANGVVLHCVYLGLPSVWFVSFYLALYCSISIFVTQTCSPGPPLLVLFLCEVPSSQMSRFDIQKFLHLPHGLLRSQTGPMHPRSDDLMEKARSRTGPRQHIFFQDSCTQSLSHKTRQPSS